MFPLADLSRSPRHCSYVVSIEPLDSGDEDFSFNMVAPLNGASGARSIQSVGSVD
jgi:hypothetical protein